MDVGLSYEVLAQIAHVLGSCWLVEHLGKWTKKHWQFLLLILCYAAFKEFYIDPRFENVVTRGAMCWIFFSGLLAELQDMFYHILDKFGVIV